MRASLAADHQWTAQVVGKHRTSLGSAARESALAAGIDTFDFLQR